MTDTSNFDTQEKVDVLIKAAFGFPSAEESRQWYEEVAVPYNNYIIGDELLLDKIPSIPDFDISGTVRIASDINLQESDFMSYSYDINNKSGCSIVDDSTGVIRRIQLLVLDQTPNLATAGASWYKLDANNSNVLKNSFQFNYNKYTDDNGNVIQPYLYRVNTQREIDPDLTLPMGKKGGNWFIDLKSGVLFFPDFNNFLNGTQTDSNYQLNVVDNKPVLSIYTYIGRIGSSKILTIGDSHSNVSSPENKQVFINTTNNTIYRYDGTEWISIGGGGGGGINLNSDLDLNANLSVTGDTSLNDVSMNGNVDIKGNLSITGNLSVNTLENTTIINTTLNKYQTIVTEDISLNGNLSVSGDVSFNSTGRVDICGNLYAQYPDNSIPIAAINGIQSQGQFDANSDLSLNAKLLVGQDVSFNSNLYVEGTSLFNQRVDVCGNFYAQYPNNSIPIQAIDGIIGGGGGGGGSIVNNLGQTFFDVISQQPNKFTFDSSSNTTASLTINWKYDDIIGKITNTTYQAFLNFQNTAANKNIPYINELQIDISSSNTIIGWIPYQTINVSNVDYNTSIYKTLTITKNTGSGNLVNVFNSTNQFDIRIYGKNNAYNFPDENTRSLIFNNVAFKVPKAPGAPDYISTIINNYQQITLTYNFNEPELGDTQSPGKLSTSQTKYQQNDTLSSTSYSVDNTIQVDTETDDNVIRNSNFTVILQSLRAGTTYNFLTRIKNDLIDSYSINNTDWDNVGSSIVFDTNGPTGYTPLPIGLSSFTPNLSYNTTTYVTTSDLLNTPIVYINTSGTQTLVPSNSGIQTFEITNSLATNADTTGYGKWVDISENLVEIKASVGITLKQTISYQGFTPSETNNKSGTASRTNVNVNYINYFNTPSQADIYTDAQRKGYRLKGTFQLLSITNDDIENFIGPARTDPYVLKQEFIRDTAKVGGTNTTVSTNIYVDTLPNNPTVTHTNSAIVTAVVWTMGIPSVKKYKIECERTYTDVNSSYGFIRGDRKLAYFDGVTNSSNIVNSTGFTTGTITIQRNAIQTTEPSIGQYNYDTTAFATNTNHCLQSLHYTTQQTSTSTTLTINETVYSLKTNGIAKNTPVIVSHHFDKNSYNGLGDSLVSKLSLTDIYEINNSAISKLSNNLDSITVSEYTSHTVIPQTYTLLYYNGLFRTSGYPDVTTYTWNSIEDNYTYNHASTGLTTSGDRVTNGTRYKWIVLKINKNSSSQYSFNGIDYNIIGSTAKYLSANMFNPLFGETTVNNLFDSENSDVIGFCRVTNNSVLNNGANFYVYGNFKRGLNSQAIWVQVGSMPSGGGGYNTIDAPSFGCKVTNGTDKGIYVDTTQMDNDLHVFIGIKVP